MDYELIELTYKRPCRKPKDIISIAWSFRDAIGDTMMEKWEDLYVKIIGLSDQLGGKIKYVVCSKDFWEKFWSDRGFTLYGNPKNVDDLVRVAKFGRINSWDVWTAENSLVQNRIVVTCSEGKGVIIVSDLGDL